MNYSLAFLLLAASTALAQTPDACAANCTSQWKQCASGPNANHATCAARYMGCLGYDPFTLPGSSYLSPTACSATSTVSGTATGSTAPTTTSAPGQDACAANCTAQWEQCAKGPNANHATCGQFYMACLGYNPFTLPGSSYLSPTACSSTTSGMPATTSSSRPPPVTPTTDTTRTITSTTTPTVSVAPSTTSTSTTSMPSSQPTTVTKNAGNALSIGDFRIAYLGLFGLFL